MGATGEFGILATRSVAWLMQAALEDDNLWMATSKQANYFVAQLARHLFISVALALAITAGLSLAVLLYLDAQIDAIAGVLLGIRAFVSFCIVSCMALLIKKLQASTAALTKARDDALAASRRDSLTGLLNHGAIVNEVELLPALPGTHAILMADVDSLKSINDRYGHITGDQVLMSVAACLSQGDALVGRYGGDEFLIVLKSSGREAAESYRQKVAVSLRDSTIFDQVTGDLISVQMSIGIAMFPAEATTIEALIPLSDAAMYAMKRQRPGSRSTGQISYLRPVDGTPVPDKSIAA